MPVSPILDASGRNFVDVDSRESMQQAADQSLQSLGLVKGTDGSWTVDAQAMARVLRERQRRATMTRVPQMGSNVMRTPQGTVSRSSTMVDRLDMPVLRRIRERSPMLQVIHQARTYQIRRLVQRWSGKRGDVGWRVVHRDHTESGATPPDGFSKWMKLGEEIIQTPSSTYCPSFSDATVMLNEDLLTINRPIVEPLHSLLDRRKLVGWKPVDGALIEPTFKYLDGWLKGNPHVTDQLRGLDKASALKMLSTSLGHDLTARWALVRDGVMEGVFGDDELIVAPQQNRTDVNFAGYPPSTVEVALRLVAAFDATWEHNTGYHTRGWMPEFILGVKGDYQDEDLDAFRDMLTEQALGVANAWRPLVFALPGEGGIEKLDMKPSNRDMMFEIWLSAIIALLCAVYRMDPSVVNAKPWSGGSSGGLSEPSRMGEIELANEDGLQSDIGHLTEAIYNPLLARIHPDLLLLWEYGDYDALKEAQVYEIQARVSKTRNEVRLEVGMTAKGYWVPDEEYDGLSDEDKKKYDDNPWNMPSDPSFAQMLTQRAQMAQQKDMMAMYGGGGDDGGAGGMQSPMPGQDAQDYGNAPQGTPFGAPAPAGSAMQKARPDTVIKIFKR